MYVQVRKYASTQVREVKVRHRDNTARSWPKCKPRLCTWHPSDSKHGGRLYCTDKIEGEPELVEFGGGGQGGWWKSLKKVQKDVKSYYMKTSVFFPERKASWNNFFEQYVPWDGLASLPDERKPVFKLSTDPKPAQERSVDPRVTKLLNSTGRDDEGRQRLWYSEGKDVAVYEPAKIWANFSGRMVDDTMYSMAAQKKSKV